jgi:hypothetical protein
MSLEIGILSSGCLFQGFENTKEKVPAFPPKGVVKGHWLHLQNTKCNKQVIV